MRFPTRSLGIAICEAHFGGGRVNIDLICYNEIYRIVEMNTSANDTEVTLGELRVKMGVFTEARVH